MSTSRLANLSYEVWYTYNGEPWSDPNYVLAGDLPYLDQGLKIEYLQTIEFN